MMAVQALEAHGVTPGGGEVLVTGASGGVGSVATAILANLGYDVTASTGRPEQGDYLTGLGAKTIIDRAELSELPSRPLARERFAGAIDNVGGATLSNLLTQISYGGSVAAVGLTGGNELSSTVLPFLLRGVNLLGIESVMCPKAPRIETWKRVAKDLPMDKLRAMVETHALDDLPRLGKEILSGAVRGRAVIKVA
jgi:acrylyl-CoA reductase (NADPH)